MMARLAPISLLCFIFLSGCSDEIPRAVVRGIVSYRGEPIQDGVIMFIPDNAAPVALKISEGHYDTETDANDKRGAVIGHCTVRIYGDKPSGKKVKDPMSGVVMEENIQFIPSQFNENTELTADVKPGEQEINFDLVP